MGSFPSKSLGTSKAGVLERVNKSKKGAQVSQLRQKASLTKDASLITRVSWGTHPFVPSLCLKNTAQGGESLAQSPVILGFDRDLHTVIEVRSVFMAMRGSIAPVQSHPSGVIDIVTPGGGHMKSGALKRGRNPGIKKDFKPDTPRR